LPGWASSPSGRLVTQFRTFGYRQSRYLGREILTPLMHGDPRPLLKYVAVATALGVPVDTAYDVASGRGVKDNPKDIALGGLARAGGLGLAGDVYRGAKNIGTLPALQNTFAPYAKKAAAPEYVLPGRPSGRDSGRSSGRSSGR
jgi:hypothetical protein